jgi:hypothetical protein
MKSMGFQSRPAVVTILCVLVAIPGPAVAEPGVNGCPVAGKARMRSSVEMYEAATGSEAIARFTGGEVTLKATEFPKGSNRAKIATEGFHVDGFVASKDIPVFAARDLAAHRGHVWIAAQRQVRVIDAAPGKLQVEREVTTPMKQTFRAWASCESLTLTEGVPAGWTPPGGARGYLLKKPAIALFDQAGGTTVTTIIRMFLTEQKDLLIISRG